MVSTLALPRQDAWEWRSPSPTGNRIANFAHGLGFFVGVGENGSILTSPDGATWTHRASGIAEPLKRVVFGAAKFVAISLNHILTSTDGITWVRQDRGLLDIDYGNGVFVAFASTQTNDSPSEALTSTDGVTWMSRRDFAYIPGRLRFANGVFVAPDTGGGVETTTDGVTWNPVQVANIVPSQYYFTAGNNRFLLSYGSTTYLSTNGTTWREVTAVVPFQNQTVRVPELGLQSTLGFAGDYFYLQQCRSASDSHRQYRSTDGETWTPLNDPLSNFDFSTLASGGGVSVATEVTTQYGTPNQRSYAIHSSADGLSWTNRTSVINPVADHGWPVYGLGRYFYSGKSSNDGLAWSDCGFEPTHAAGERLFRIVSLSRSGNPLPAVTAGDSFTTIVTVSSDGLTSTRVDVGMCTPRSVAFGNGLYVIVGDDGAVSISSDALTWTGATSGTSKNLSAVIFALSRFIAVGQDGTFIFSDNGLAWSENVSPCVVDLNFSALAANASRVIATAISAPAVVPSGVTMPRNVPVLFAADHAFTSVVALRDTFLAVSNDGDSWFRQAELWKSSDGLSWSPIGLPVGVADFGTPLLAAGNDTALLVAPVGTRTSSTSFALMQSISTGANPPAITHPPVGKSVARGESVSFAVGATGTGPFNYQWYHSGNAVVGETDSVLTLAGVKDADAGNYTVKVTNPFGAATTVAAVLTVAPPVPLKITHQPVGGSVFEFQSLVLGVQVTGSGPITYQWRRNGLPVSGATASTYEIWTASYSIDDYVGDYDVVITAPYSSLASQVAIVTRGGPSVSLSPTGAIAVNVGSTLQLTVTATGVAPFTYRWLTPGGGMLAGATGPILILPWVTLADSSPYWVEVTDGTGKSVRAVTNVSVIAVDTAPVSPGAAVAAGQDITLRAGSVTAFDVQFQWRRNGITIGGATRASYTIRSFSSVNEGEYDVVTTASDGTKSVRSEVSLTLEESRLLNLSTRAFAGSGEDTLIQGFVLRGAASPDSSDLLVRSIGPSLTGISVDDALADPSKRVLRHDRLWPKMTTGRRPSQRRAASAPPLPTFPDSVHPR